MAAKKACASSGVVNGEHTRAKADRKEAEKRIKLVLKGKGGEERGTENTQGNS